MRKSLIAKLLMVAGAAGLVAACGGGGGGGGGVGSIPTPPPPPPPPPTQTGPIFAPGVTTSTDFAVLGYERAAGDLTVADLAATGFSVRYDAASQSYLIGLPSFGGGAPGAFSRTDHSSQSYFGTIPDSTGTASLTVRNPATGPYQYSTVATVDGPDAPSNSVLAFGLATPAGSAPVTGTATYSAHLAGAVLGVNYGVKGTAELTFNFGAGTLGGTMSPIVVDGWGTDFVVGPYTFTNTVYSSGSTTFSGGLTHSINSQTGAFSGRLTGPVGQELIGRFNLQFIDPYFATTETMYGAFVGRRQ